MAESGTLINSFSWDIKRQIGCGESSERSYISEGVHGTLAINLP